MAAPGRRVQPARLGAGQTARHPYPPQAAPRHYPPPSQHPQQHPQPQYPPPPGRRRARARGRSHLRYVLALLLLVPLTAGLQYAFDHMETRPPMHQAVTVARGDSAEYAGATWKLSGARPGPPQRGVRLPRGVVLLYVAVTVRPADQAASRRIESCAFEAVDGAGRTWETASLSVPDYEGLGDPATSCSTPSGDFDQRPIRPGQSQRVVTAFVVPEKAAEEVRLQVRVDGGAPRYLELLQD